MVVQYVFLSAPRLLPYDQFYVLNLTHYERPSNYRPLSYCVLDAVLYARDCLLFFPKVTITKTRND